jgi:hypothetical protein
MEVRKVLILVHGTFAKNAPWIQEDSNFVKGIKDNLKQYADIKVVSFDWSGKNSYFKRVEAGKKLAAELEAIAVEYPKSEKIVIGHSHGGNVIFYAFKNIPNRINDFKIVTMATPFLISSKRPHKATFLLIQILVSFIIPAAIFFISMTLGFLSIVGIYQSFFDAKNGKGSDLIMAIPLLVASLLAFRYAKKKLGEKEFFEKDYDEKATEILNKISINVTSPQIALLSITYKLDEAKAWLSGSSNLSNKTSYLFEFIGRKSWFMIRVAGAALVFTFWIGCIIALLAGFFHFNFNPFENFGEIIFKANIWLWFCYFLLFLFFNLLFYSFSASPVFYGWKSWNHFFYIKTVPSAYPLHVSNPTCIELIISKKKFFPLRHSMIYDDPNVHYLIAEWIKGNVHSTSPIRIKIK